MPSVQDKKNLASLKKGQKTSLLKPLILIWNPKAKISDTLPFDECGVSCRLTKNRRLLSKADAVLIQMKWMQRDVLPARSKMYAYNGFF